MDQNICRRFLTRPALVLAFAALVASAEAQQSSAAVNPDAIKALNDMASYLRNLKAFQVESATTTDEVQDDGQLIQYTAKINFVVQMPNKLLATAASDRNERTFIYDGKTFTMFAHRAGYYATVPAPPTLRELDDALSEKYDIELPLGRSLPLRFSGLERLRHQGGHGHRSERGQRNHLRALCLPAGRRRLAGLDSEGRVPAAAQARHHDDDRSRPAAAHGDLHLESGAVVQPGVVHVRAAGRRQEDRPGRGWRAARRQMMARAFVARGGRPGGPVVRPGRRACAAPRRRRRSHQCQP
jgi:hypothetical protein